METLLDRLKPEYKAELELSKESYPVTVEEIESNLLGSNTILNIKYGIILALLSFATKKVLNFDNVSDLFND